MLQVSDLTVRYGRTIQGLADVDVDVPPGSVTAVLGANGAGKSTLLRAISNTLPLHRGKVTSGSITLEGRDLAKLDPAEIVMAGVVQVPEGRQVFTTMSVEENLRAGGLIVAKEKREPARDRVFELFPRLAERRTQRAGLLSGGEQQMLAMGRALMSSPRLLLLDEPSLGLAPKMITLIGEIIREINAAGTAVLLVEQNAAMALKVAEDVVVLEVGRLALKGRAADVKDSPELAALYLGGHGDSQDDTLSESAEGTDAEPATPVARRTLSKWQG
ncbi:ABC transporter ATP-binding protein [Sporichthya sp.]|uniref:ABC transporter ATP-binding protein n=1 Tax=Sporichthya sp. TaxID=65475 RepID=UPI0017A698C3|nr:ABC transporter ATP-binding protein [Sporichthya sp.]